MKTPHQMRTRYLIFRILLSRFYTVWGYTIEITLFWKFLYHMTLLFNRLHVKLSRHLFIQLLPSLRKNNLWVLGFYSYHVDIVLKAILLNPKTLINPIKSQERISESVICLISEENYLVLLELSSSKETPKKF